MSSSRVVQGHWFKGLDAHHSHRPLAFCSMAEVGSAEPGAVAIAAVVTADALRDALRAALQGKDLWTISIRQCREQVAQAVGLAPDGLADREDEFKELLTVVVQELTAAEVAIKPLAKIIGEEENKNAVQVVHLITLARVLSAALADGRQYKDLQTVDRKTIADAVADAFDNPLVQGAGTRGGRPRVDRESIVKLIVVFRERHDDGSIHFHIAVQLTKPYRFVSVKNTLRERHLLPSHFSCSHTCIWSAVRYGYIATPKKTDVDSEPWIRTATFNGFADKQTTVDLFEISQEP